jgi:hypothetical protein
MCSFRIGSFFTRLHNNLMRNALSKIQHVPVMKSRILLQRIKNWAYRQLREYFSKVRQSRLHQAMV